MGSGGAAAAADAADVGAGGGDGRCVVVMVVVVVMGGTPQPQSPGSNAAAAGGMGIGTPAASERQLLVPELLAAGGAGGAGAGAAWPAAVGAKPNPLAVVVVEGPAGTAIGLGCTRRCAGIGILASPWLCAWCSDDERRLGGAPGGVAATGIAPGPAPAGINTHC